jgi:hypothetical protein
MFVGANSYVCENIPVFIKQELNATTSNFYLREEAQLLQGTELAPIKDW